MVHGDVEMSDHMGNGHDGKNPSHDDDEFSTKHNDSSITTQQSRLRMLERAATRAISELSMTFGGPRGEDVYPWINVVVIAVAVGTIEYIPAAVLAWSIPQKYDLLDYTINNYGVLIMTLVNVTLCVGLVLVAVLVNHWVPAASGSGIPHLIAYLFNGKRTKKYLLSVRMVLAKMVGIVLAISGGLAVGREGPAIHIGAGVGDLTNRGINKVLEWWTGEKVPFDGVVKANVVMMGATAGFASAFRSPMGGMMYCVEELASHWDIKSHMMTGAQTFLVAATSAFITDLIVRMTSDGKSIEFSSIIIFDGNEASLNKGAVYHYNDLVGFMLIAILCGVLSGYTTKISIWLRNWRFATEHRQKLWVIARDAALIAAISAVAFSLETMVFTHCKHVPGGDDDHRRLSAGGGERKFVRYTCSDQDYSQLASLSLTGEEGVIRHLLSRDEEEFDVKALLLFFAVYLPLSLLVRSLPLPMGSFVPNLLVGSLVGRIIGELAEFTFPNRLISEPGVYALIGAAAMLGAWTKTMIAVVATLLEITGDVGMTVPMIAAVIIAREVSTKIAHHSYTHTVFYQLIDDPDSDEPPILHPMDWEPPGLSGRQVKRGSIDHGIILEEDEDEDSNDDPMEMPTESTPTQNQITRKSLSARL